VHSSDRDVVKVRQVLSSAVASESFTRTMSVPRSATISAYRAVWADAGFAVLQVNYRSSTGYGTWWQDAIHAAPGLPAGLRPGAVRRLARTAAGCYAETA
jgi:hypothetical protein